MTTSTTESPTEARATRSPAQIAAARKNLRPWARGTSGNPKGWPKEARAPREKLARLCRRHTKEAVQILLRLARSAEDEAVRLRAAQALLHEAFGAVPTSQTVVRDGPAVNIDLRNMAPLRRDLSVAEAMEMLQTIAPPPAEIDDAAPSSEELS